MTVVALLAVSRVSSRDIEPFTSAPNELQYDLFSRALDVNQKLCFIESGANKDAIELDVPLQEFSSEILSELTKMHAACADILETEVIDVLFQRIKSQDPDVQHNSAK
ncbi:Protein of unknown function, partial [Gryllus bimaculatus]